MKEIRYTESKCNFLCKIQIKDKWFTIAKKLTKQIKRLSCAWMMYRKEHFDGGTHIGAQRPEEPSSLFSGARTLDSIDRFTSG